MTLPLHTLLVECANQEGFPLAGTVDFQLAFRDSENLIQKHIAHFDHWLKSGFSGAMEYLARGRDKRADPRLLFSEAKSILCVAIPYPRSPAGASSSEQGPRYARYLQGGDYHKEIADKLDRVMHSAQARWTSQGAPELKWKVCVDTSAVLERSWAALAGLGWIGKNTLLIHPKEGSYLFLGEVLINQSTGQAPAPRPDFCGHCTRCLDACPTQAFEAPHLLNSNRCISYLTLEKRGELPIDPQIKSQIGPWIAGCDICQEACPYNLKPSRSGYPKADLSNESNATTLASWKELLEETPERYQLRVKNSALKRVKPEQFSRNLAIALKNCLKESSSRLKSLIRHRAASEKNEFARAEWDATEAYSDSKKIMLQIVNHKGKLESDSPEENAGSSQSLGRDRVSPSNDRGESVLP